MAKKKRTAKKEVLVVASKVKAYIKSKKMMTSSDAIGALNFHFIFLGKNLKVLKKTTMTFEDTFIDARGSKKFNLLLKPALVEAGIKDLF